MRKKDGGKKKGKGFERLNRAGGGGPSPSVKCPEGPTSGSGAQEFFIAKSLREKEQFQGKGASEKKKNSFHQLRE